jgi:integrase
MKSVELNAIVQNTRSEDWQDIFLTDFHTCMLLYEIINLKWSAINLKERTIIVQDNETFTTKSKKERSILIAVHLNNNPLKRINCFYFCDPQKYLLYYYYLLSICSVEILFINFFPIRLNRFIMILSY